jgi:hypothetical protein
LRAVVLRAWRQLQRIRRNNAALHEMPIAALQALTANINRDSKKRPEPFRPADFAMYSGSADDSRVLSAEVAAVALALRAEDKDSPILLTVWQQVVASATPDIRTPSIRALHNDDKSIWVLCPTWEGRNIRGGLVCAKGRFPTPVTLRDVDRPLATYAVTIPDKPGAYAWAQGGLLLTAAGKLGGSTGTGSA